MNYQAEITAFIMANLQYIIVSITVMIFLALIIFINLNMKLSKMNKRYRKLMTGMEGHNLEQLLVGHIEEVRQAMKKVNALEDSYKSLDKISYNCIQKVGIVRFNAFEDTGSDLSFAVAMLDRENNGVVLSNIFGRNESRTYAKPINGGQSQYFLTDEEKEALDIAQNKASKR